MAIASCEREGGGCSGRWLCRRAASWGRGSAARGLPEPPRSLALSGSPQAGCYTLAALRQRADAICSAGNNFRMGITFPPNAESLQTLPAAGQVPNGTPRSQPRGCCTHWVGAFVRADLLHAVQPCSQQPVLMFRAPMQSRCMAEIH